MWNEVKVDWAIKEVNGAFGEVQHECLLTWTEEHCGDGGNNLCRIMVSIINCANSVLCMCIVGNVQE